MRSAGRLPANRFAEIFVHRSIRLVTELSYCPFVQAPQHHAACEPVLWDNGDESCRYRTLVSTWDSGAASRTEIGIAAFKTEHQISSNKILGRRLCLQTSIPIQIKNLAFLASLVTSLIQRLVRPSSNTVGAPRFSEKQSRQTTSIR